MGSHANNGGDQVVADAYWLGRRAVAMEQFGSAVGVLQGEGFKDEDVQLLLAERLAEGPDALNSPRKADFPDEP